MSHHNSPNNVVSPRRRLVAVPEEDLAAVLAQLAELRSLVGLALDLLRLVPGIGAHPLEMTPRWELQERLGLHRTSQPSSGPAKGA